jgi:hypothetical protein
LGALLVVVPVQQSRQQRIEVDRLFFEERNHLSQTVRQLIAIGIK